MAFKPITSAERIEALKILTKKAGDRFLGLNYGLMLGLPESDPNAIRKQLRILQASGIIKLTDQCGIWERLI
jgi:hypothetical protein